jgi:hypothetical protein
MESNRKRGQGSSRTAAPVKEEDGGPFFSSQLSNLRIRMTTFSSSAHAGHLYDSVIGPLLSVEISLREILILTC